MKSIFVLISCLQFLAGANKEMQFKNILGDKKKFNDSIEVIKYYKDFDFFKFSGKEVNPPNKKEKLTYPFVKITYSQKMEILSYEYFFNKKNSEKIFLTKNNLGELIEGDLTFVPFKIEVSTLPVRNNFIFTDSVIYKVRLSHNPANVQFNKEPVSIESIELFYPNGLQVDYFFGSLGIADFKELTSYKIKIMIAEKKYIVCERTERDFSSKGILKLKHTYINSKEEKTYYEKCYLFEEEFNLYKWLKHNYFIFFEKACEN